MATPTNALPPGTQLDEFTIENVLGGGGFSIVYLATPIGGGDGVVIKEYMPSSMAKRGKDMSVVPASAKLNDRFAHGRRLFFQEASTLTTLKHPNIVNVINFFRDNGTVYMVMQYEEGANLQAYIKKHKGNFSEEFVLTVFLPLLDGLQTIHSKGLLHLDIKPSNIHLRTGGSPLLLDFGAVHEMMQTRQFQPNQVITPGFSPIEQLDPGGYVGPWTDIYAMGATMRACIEGVSPPCSPDRREKDTLRPAVSAFKRKYAPHILEAVDWAMEVDPLLRPQSVEKLIDALKGKNVQSKKSLFRF